MLKRLCADISTLLIKISIERIAIIATWITKTTNQNARQQQAGKSHAKGNIRARMKSTPAKKERIAVSVKEESKIEIWSPNNSSKVKKFT